MCKVDVKLLVKSISQLLACCSAGHWTKMWSRSSNEPWQSVDKVQNSEEESQWRYHPDNIFAWTVAIAILYGEFPAVLHIGCGATNDIKFGWKNVKRF